MRSTLNVASSNLTPIFKDMDSLDSATAKKLKVPELKQELAQRGLSTGGRKDELLSRLLEHLEGPTHKEEAPPLDSASPNPAEADTTAKDLKQSTPAPIVTAPAVAATSSTTSSTASPAPKSPTTPTKPTSGMSEEEKRRARAARFGLPVVPSTTDDNVKRRERAKRFGNSVSNSTTAATTESSGLKGGSVMEDPEVLKRRQERFGIVNPESQKVSALSEEEEKKRKRQERFGILPATEKAKKQKV
ncbi:hypothetical protein HK104_004952 [Borealophlyctis nickersoniae]|nr:hypothetical protein HK104_004952 [Borealophlyctis nickersoniae]